MFITFFGIIVVAFFSVMAHSLSYDDRDSFIKPISSMTKNSALSDSYGYMQNYMIFPHLKNSVDYKGFVYAK